jgi:hypothetical protein
MRLLAGFIPAATKVAERSGIRADRYYEDEEVQRWLGQLALFLSGPQAVEADAVDIFPEKLWTIAGKTRVRLAHGLFASLFFLLSIALARDSIEVVYQTASTRSYTVPHWLITTVLGLPMLILLGSLIRASASTSPVPALLGRPRFHRIKVQPTSASRLRSWSMNILRASFVDGYRGKIIFSILVASVLTFLAIATSGFSLGDIIGLVALIVILYTIIGFVQITGNVLSQALRSFVDFAPMEPRRPYDALRQDRLTGILLVISLLAISLVYNILSPHTSPNDTLSTLAAACFTLTFAMVISGTATRYSIAVTAMSLKGQLPFRLKQFLSWSVEAGLLREAGTAYQFRHIELQRWLNENYEISTA